MLVVCHSVRQTGICYLTHGFPLYTGKEFLGNLLYDRLETDG